MDQWGLEVGRHLKKQVKTMLPLVQLPVRTKLNLRMSLRFLVLSAHVHAGGIPNKYKTQTETTPPLP